MILKRLLNTINHALDLYDLYIIVPLEVMIVECRYDPYISKTKVDFKNRYMVSEKIDHIMGLMKIYFSTMKIRTRYTQI